MQNFRIAGIIFYFFSKRWVSCAQYVKAHFVPFRHFWAEIGAGRMYIICKCRREVGWMKNMIEYHSSTNEKYGKYIKYIYDKYMKNMVEYHPSTNPRHTIEISHPIFHNKNNNLGDNTQYKITTSAIIYLVLLLTDGCLRVKVHIEGLFHWVVIEPRMWV